MALPTSALDLVRVLEQAAQAVGVAGRAVARDSASEFGFLAVKSARLDFHFDLTVTREGKTAQTGLGIRNALFGPTVGLESSREASSNRGSITLDIVAVAQPPEGTGPVPAPPGIRPRDLGPFGDKLKALRTALQGATWPPAQVARVRTLIDVAEQAAQGGDLKGAEAVLGLLVEALTPVQPEPAPEPPGKPKVLKPRGSVPRGEVG